MRAGEVIAEIEVDKATVDLEVTRRLARWPGSWCRPGRRRSRWASVLAILDETDGQTARRMQRASRLAPSPRAESRRTAHAVQVRSAGPLAAGSGRSTIDASPLARSMARQAGLDSLSLTAADRRAASSRPMSLKALGLAAELRRSASRRPVAATGPGTPHMPMLRIEEIPHSRIRQVIAQRLSESKRTIPHFYLEVELPDRCLAAVARRDRRRGATEGRSSRSTTSPSAPRPWP